MSTRPAIDRYGLLDKSSHLNYENRIDKLVREYQIAVETQQIVGDKLAECARNEGVNRWVNCRELSARYFELCDDRFHGMLLPAVSEDLNRQRIMKTTLKK